MAPRPFANEPLLELRRRRSAGRSTDALAALDARLPLEVPMSIGDERRPGRARSPRSTRARPTGSSPTPHAATAEHVDRRRRGRAAEALRAWSRTPRRPSAPPRSRRAAGHPARAPAASSPRSPSASAPSPGRRPTRDVCEAIDFLEYYARGALALDARPRADPAARRAQHAALRAARRHRRDRAVELPARDPARDDCRRARDRQRRRAQARRAGPRRAR